MSFVGLQSFFSKLIAAQILPDDGGFLGNVWSVIGNLVIGLFQSLCSTFYIVCKWFLAVVDFLQYFIQKLIGLDYWLNVSSGTATIEGATDADLLFSFLYSDTVQEVFRAMIGVFFILLIVFTIFQIIKQEWTFATGGFDQNGEGNSKVKILRGSMKAIALVITFPLIMIIGIISSNAILASLINALSINMSQTFGGTLFGISAQSANKYRVYADNDQRVATTQAVNFNVAADGTTIVYGPTGDNDYYTYVANYDDYMKKLYEEDGDGKRTVKEYSVNSIFDVVVPRKAKSFNGYCVGLGDADNRQYFLVACDNSNKTAMYYYLRNVLGAKILYKDATKNQAQGITSDDQYDSLFKNIKNKIESSPSGSQAYIKGLNVNSFGEDNEVVKAAYNTWNYTSVYKTAKAFNTAVDYGLMNSSVLQKYGLSGSSTKLLYNSDEISSYFDGGQFGVVQKQAEYYVMADVIDFMNNSGLTLYMVDATSSMIKWNYAGYQPGSKWVTNNVATGGFAGVKYDGDYGETVLPFIVSYSEECSDVEAGNVLYLAEYGAKNEVEGAVYLMCYKVNDGTNAKYVPLLNGEKFIDPLTGYDYKFESDYLSSNYNGVIVAKGIFETSSSNAQLGEPTYIETSTTVEHSGGGSALASLIGKLFNTEDYYYYELVQEGELTQFVAEIEGENLSYTVTDIKTSTDFSDVAISCEVDGTDNIWKAYKGEEQSTLSAELIKSLTVNLKYSGSAGTGHSVLLSTNATYLNTFEEDDSLHTFISKEGYIFLIQTTTSEDCFRIFGLSKTGDVNEAEVDTVSVGTGTDALTAFKKEYQVKVAYKETESAVVGEITEDIELTINDIEKVEDTTTSTLFKATDKINTGKIIKPGTTDVVLWEDTRIDFHFKLDLKANNNQLIGFKTPVPVVPTPTPVTRLPDKLSFAPSIGVRPFADTSEGLGQTAVPYAATEKSYTSTVYELYLYDYFTAAVSDGGTSYKLYQFNSDNLDAAPTEIAKKSSEVTIKCIVNMQDFSWRDPENQYALYNGKSYVATIYKNKNEHIDTTYLTSELATKTTKILYDYEEYYNIVSQNYFTSLNSSTDGDGNRVIGAKDYYKEIKGSLMIGCYRDNAGGIVGTGSWFSDLFFLGMDYKIDLFGGWRFKTALATERMSNGDLAGYFTLEDGISFDYFFERTAIQSLHKEGVGLNTFFVPSKIAYWIILIASALIIKVLGTSLWGVIKRFYEITLYFIAMPAVASTIPLDDGQRFKMSITTPMLEKVLGTYGVMLGLNVFFVLLAPVKSLSNIFTAEDIATSGSYFLKHLPISAKLLNSYVYILFVLVAFTMIEALPKTITQIIGVDKNASSDILSSGASTKDSVSKSIKSAGDIISGRAIADKFGETGEALAGAIPGSAIVGKLFKGAKNFGKGDEAQGGGNGQPRTGDGDGTPESEVTAGGPDDAVPGGGPGEGGPGDGTGDGDVDGEGAPRTDFDGEGEIDPMEELPGGSSMLPGVLGAVENAVSTGIEATATAAGAVVEGAAEGIGAAAAGVGKGVGAAAEGVGKGVGAAAEGIGEGIGAMAEGIGEGIGDAVGEGLDGFTGFAEEAADEIEDDMAEEATESAAKKIIRNPEVAAKESRIDELGETIAENTIDGMTVDESIEFYEGVAGEREGYQAQIDEEKAKRTGWINAAVAAGLAEEGTDDFVTTTDQRVHDEQGIPFASEVAESSEKLRGLEGKVAECDEAEASKTELENAVAEQNGLKEEVAEAEANGTANIEVEDAVEEVAEDVAEAATETGEKVTDAAEEVAEEVADATGGEDGEGGKKPKKKLGDMSIQEIHEAQVDAIKNFGGKIWAGITAGASFLGDKISKPFKAAGGWIKDRAVDFYGAVLKPIGEKVKGAGQWVGDKVKGAGQWVGGKFVAAKNWAGDKLGKAGRWVKDHAIALKDGVVNSKFGQGVKKFGQGVKNFAIGTKSFLTKTGKAIATPFVAAGKAVKTAATAVYGKVLKPIGNFAKTVGKVTAATFLTVSKPFRAAGKAIKNVAVATYGKVLKPVGGVIKEGLTKTGKAMKTVAKKVAPVAKVAGLVGLGVIAATVPGGLLAVAAGGVLAKGAKRVVAAGANVAQKFAGGAMKVVKGAGVVGAAVLAGNMLPGIGTAAVVAGVLVHKHRKAKRMDAATARAFSEQAGGAEFTRVPTAEPTGEISEPASVPVNGTKGNEVSTPVQTYDPETKQPRTSGELVAGVANGAVEASSASDKVSRAEFNRQALDDKDFVDDKFGARANVVKNRVDSKIGRIVTNQVLSDYGEGGTMQERIRNAVVGTDSKAGLLDDNMRMQAFKASLSGKELASFNKMSEADQQKFFKDKGFDLQTTVGMDGKIGFAVTRKDGAEAVNLDQNTTNSIVSQMLSSDRIGDEAINAAIDKTNTGANVEAALAQNLALGVDYNKENASTTTSLTASAVYKKAAENDDVVAEAMLRHIEANPDSELNAQFREQLGITAETDLSNPEERARVIEQIKVFKNSGNANVISTMNADVYAQEMTGVVREKVMGGKFKTTSWDMADENTRENFKEKTAATLGTLSSHSILTGASTDDQNKILGNTAAAMMRASGSTGVSKKIQDLAFAANVSADDIAKIDPAVLKGLTGKDSAAALTEADKQFLGFVKATNKGSFDGINLQNANQFTRAFKNSDTRINAFMSLSDEQKAAAVEKSGQKGAIALMATQDATMAMSAGYLSAVEADFIKKGGIKDETANAHLNKMYADYAKANGLAETTLADADFKDVKKFLRSNASAANMVKNEMKSEGFDFTSLVNDKYNVKYARTKDEAAREHELSVEAVLNDSPESLYHAFVNSNMENKSAITNDLFNRAFSLDNPNGAGYKAALTQLNGSFDAQEMSAFMIANGYSEQDMVTAYKKAELLGETRKAGFSLDTLNKYTGQSDEVDRAVLTAMEKKATPTQFKAIANELLDNNITADDKKALAETVATSGFKGLSKADQDALLASGEYTKEDLEGLSYYELKQRAAGKSSKEIYDGIRTEVAEKKQVDLYLETQGDLIETDKLKETIDAGGNAEATTFMADSYADRVSLLSADEAKQVRRDSSLEFIGADKVAEIQGSAEYQKQADAAVTHALYTEFATNPSFSAEVAQIRKSQPFKDASKQPGFNEEEYIVKEIESRFDGRNLFGGENKERFERIREAARQDTVISIAASQDDSLATTLLTKGNDAVDLANRRRIAQVKTADNNLDSMDRVSAFAEAIQSNASLYNKANIAFREASGGKDLNDVDIMTRNNFLANEFAGKLSGRDRKWADEEKLKIDTEYAAKMMGPNAEDLIKKRKNANGDNYTSVEDFVQHAARRGLSLDQALMNEGFMTSSVVNENTSLEELNKIISKSMSQEEFDSIYNESKRENFGEETELFKGIKKDLIREQLRDGELTGAVDVGNMSRADREQYNLNQNLIRQSIRNDDNPALLANAFRNVNLLDDRKVLEELYKANGLGPTDGKSLAELKNAKDADGNFILKNEHINNYLRSHEALKDQLIDHVSANTMLGMDEETKNERQKDAVLGNNALANRVAVDMFNAEFNEKKGKRAKIERAKRLERDVIETVQTQQVNENTSIRQRLGLRANATQDEVVEALSTPHLGSQTSKAVSKMVKGMGVDFTDDVRIAEQIKKDDTLLANLGLKKGASDNDIYNALYGNAADGTAAHKNAGNVINSLAMSLHKKETIAALRADPEAFKALGLKADASDADIEAEFNKRVNKSLASNAIDFKLKNKKNRSAMEDAALALGSNDEKERAKGHEYVHQNEAKLVGEVARKHYFKTDKNGNLSLREGVDVSKFNGAIENAKGSSKLFKDSLYSQVTKAINPANGMSAAEKADFFKGQAAEGVKATGNGFAIKGIKDAFESFLGGKDPASGMKTTFGTGVQALWYKVTKKLPDQSTAYNNWNALLEKKINDVKNGGGQYANMSRAAREAEVAKLTKQKIDTKLPANFADMSNDEQRKYTESQNLLKHEAIMAGDFSQIYKSAVRVTSSGTSVLKGIANSIGYNLSFTGKMASQEIKDRHKQDLAEIDGKIARFNATKVMRNRSVDFGSNFATFANTYLTQHQTNNIVNQTNNQFIKEMASKGVTIDPNFKFNQLTADQQKRLIQMREDAFAAKMNKLHVIASKKVAKDNGVEPLSYLEQKGIETQNVKYKDGSKRYTHVQSRVNLHIPGVNWLVNKAITAKRVSDIKAYEKEYERTGGAVSEATKARYKDSFYGKRSVESAIQNQNKALELQKTFDKMAEFNRNFKGTGKEYAKQFQAQFGAMAKEMYARYGNRLSYTGGSIKSLDLSSSPVAVQQREVMKQLQEQMMKTSNRMKYGSAYIPTTASNGYVYVGKTMTNAKTTTEIKLDRMNAEDINKALRQFNEQKSASSYQALYNRLKPSLQEGFKFRNSTAFRDMNDEQRKDALGKYLAKELVKANNKVHNNNFFRSDSDRLQKLNGIYVNRAKVNNTGMSKTMLNAMTTNESKIYQNIVNNYNSAQTKYANEQANLARLTKAYKEVTSGIQSSGTRVEAKKIREQIDASQIRLSVVKKILTQETERKKTFERTIVDRKVQTLTTTVPGATRGYNMASRDVFDKYRFPRVNPTTGKKEYITRDSKAGNEVNKAIGRFVSNHIDHMMRLKMYLDKQVNSKIMNEKSAIYRDVKNMVDKQTNDFGRSIRDLERVQSSLKSEIANLKSSTKASDVALRTELENSLSRFDSVESTLTSSLDKLGVRVGEVSAIRATTPKKK